MKGDADRFLHRLVLAALTVFVVVSLLLAAFVAREIWLQQRIVGLSSSLQTNIEELEQTTEEIQSKMSELETIPESAGDSAEWEDVNDLLENVDQQLESIEETMDEVAVTSEETFESASIAQDEVDEADTITATRAHADQVFTIFAVLIGIAAIAVAIFLGMAIRVNERHLST